MGSGSVGACVPGALESLKVWGPPLETLEETLLTRGLSEVGPPAAWMRQGPLGFSQGPLLHKMVVREVLKPSHTKCGQDFFLFFPSFLPSFFFLSLYFFSLFFFLFFDVKAVDMHFS